ncbi:hypothetical protein GCU67_11670 [Modestobacter muralis]|uniref:Uncharacterized protein n=1 Tax=Modestobacter muralis TaxID=1608614 RepID=A0A6P0H7J1_9ACTN|nr:hypothetical protein [Modestobacter muralis]NEK94823.1 hypothetical protein [Modestobacter muralis]NEN51711.1 hypothetical protein [Modestobacter muralis]
MHRSTARSRRTLLAVAVPVGLVLGGALTWQSTHAAFSATAQNADNTWRSGSVVLAAGGTGGALFSGPADDDLQPGSTRSRCIRVDYTGDVPADVRLYVSTPTAAPSTLDPYLVMSVERGTDVAAGALVDPDCSSGFTPATLAYNTARADDPAAGADRTLADLKDLHHDFATGLQVAPATAPDTHLTFRVTYAVADDDAAQRSQSRATFTWEAHNR